MDKLTMAKIAKYLNVEGATFTDDNDQIVKMTLKNNEYKGITKIIMKLGSIPKDRWTKDDLCSVYQWVEYASLYGSQSVLNLSTGITLLKDLNKYLESQSYFVGYQKSLVDVVIYQLVYSFVSTLSPMEKESVVNFSRWFDHIQHHDDVRQGNPMVNFSTIYMTARAGGRH